MYDYQRSYGTGRAVASFLEFVGWVIVAFGVIAMLAGLASGGTLGMANRGFGSGETPAVLRIMAMLPGLLTSAAGMFFIMQSQQTKATLDNAEMTRDMLRLMKGAPSAESGRQTPAVSAPSAGPASGDGEPHSAPAGASGRPDTEDFDANGERVYRGMVIKRDGNRFHVGQSGFTTLGQAKRFIQQRT